MAELRMADPRMELLQAVEDGLVRRVFPINATAMPPGLPYDDLDYGPDVTPRWRRVTVEMCALQACGWVRLIDGPVRPLSLPWELTDAGRALLEAHRG